MRLCCEVQGGIAACNLCLQHVACCGLYVGRLSPSLPLSLVPSLVLTLSFSLYIFLCIVYTHGNPFLLSASLSTKKKQPWWQLPLQNKTSPAPQARWRCTPARSAPSRPRGRTCSTCHCASNVRPALSGSCSRGGRRSGPCHRPWCPCR